MNRTRGKPCLSLCCFKDVSDTGASVRKVIRGGSWNDRPHRATSSFRLDFPCWQQVYNVGFRPVIIEE